MATSTKKDGSRASAVLGLQFGDEGKGQLVDRLAAEHEVVVRFNGGANAGHTVRVGEDRFALHLLPSGVLHDGTQNLIANGVALDAAVLLEEIDRLAERGLDLEGRLWVSDRAHLVMPWHAAEDRLRDAVQGALGEAGRAIGTTGRGIGPAYADKAYRDTAFRVTDLAHPDRLRRRVAAVGRLKGRLLGDLADEADVPFEAFDTEGIVEMCLEHGRRLAPYVADTAERLRGALASGQSVLFEGAHAALLDLDHGTYPYVTSSSASGLALGAGCGVRVRGLHALGVAKAYMSRVGAGPFPTELDEERGDVLRERGREFGTTTDRPRRCGWLDLVLLRHAVRTAGVDAVALTGLGVLAGLDDVAVGTAYRRDGVRHTTVPADAAALASCEPVWEPVGTFAGPLDDVRRFEDLPAAARDLVRLVERHAAPVTHVCVGGRRDQVLAVP